MENHGGENGMIKRDQAGEVKVFIERKEEEKWNYRIGTGKQELVRRFMTFAAGFLIRDPTHMSAPT